MDPLSARPVAPALFGIGVESLVGRSAGIDAFRAMLNLKIIWSAAAGPGHPLAADQGRTAAGWAVLGTFAAFHSLWFITACALRAV